jgi:small GTP-binding protein
MSEPIEQKDYEILPDDYTQYDLSFKIIVIGDSGVGKSCFTNKATKNFFEEDYNATIGFEFFNFNIKLSDKIIKLQIWDTCGQELYRSLITNFYRNASLAIIVYEVTSLDSFNNVEMWLRELRIHSSPNIKIILVGNKIDLAERRKVTTKQGEEFAKVNNLVKFVETSAKEGINTQSTFIEIAKLLFTEYNNFNKDDEKSLVSEKTKSRDSITSDATGSLHVEGGKKIQLKNKKCC